MATAPKPPPISTPLVDAKGVLSRPWYEYLTGGVKYSVNVNTGVAAAQAAAVQAQAVAEAAAQQAQDVAGETLSFSASVSPLFASDAVSGGGQTATTNSVTVTPTGGTGPYTYAWTKDSGDVFTLSGASSASTTFSIASLPAGDTRSAVYRCTVTDSLAATCSVTIGVTVYDITF